ncbi:MAG: hypothetical protein AAF713_16830 [Pseudomonadota bacterium]
MTGKQRLALKVAAGLWVVWGLVHTVAGVMVMSGPVEGGFQAIADAVDPSTLTGPFPDAVGGVLGQHAWNLLWFGVATTIGAIFVWRGSATAIWVTAMIGGLADVGYLLFVDLAGFANFVPGTVMTLICATAILLSGWVLLTRDAGAVQMS